MTRTIVYIDGFNLYYRAQELGLPVTLLSPSGKTAVTLASNATSIRHVAPYVGPCQMPDPVTLPDGRSIRKPAGW